MFSDFFSGMTCLFRGFRLLSKGGVRRFVLFPFLINVIVFTGALWLGLTQFDSLLNWLLPESRGWWSDYVRAALWTIFAVIAMLIVFFAFTLLANLVGAPFNGLLSEKVELLLSGRTPHQGEGVREMLSTILPSIKSELRKLRYFLFLGGAVFILVLIPGVNVAAPLFWFVFTSWMLALEYISYPLENNSMYFKQVRRELKKKKSLALGFGITVMLASMIPLINFFVMPASVAGATLLWTEHMKKEAAVQ